VNVDGWAGKPGSAGRAKMAMGRERKSQVRPSSVVKGFKGRDKR